MRPERQRDLILYVWDYFFISHGPPAGDELAWGVIERATQRIRESEVVLDASKPSDVRLRAARRVRDSARRALRHVDVLSSAPDRRVVDGLEALAAFADALVDELRDRARELVLD